MPILPSTSSPRPALVASRRAPAVASAPARLLAAAIVAIAVAAPSGPALAAPGADTDEKKAQELFVEGMRLLNKKRYAEACEKLAESQKLDPGMGTQFRLAECYEKLGRLASAYDQFVAVADAAKEAQKLDRETVARKRAAALEPRVAKLTIEIPKAVAELPGLEVTRDGAPVGKELWGTPIPVDPGDHIVNVRAPGKKPWEGKVWAEGSSKLLVSVAALEDIAKPAPPKPKPRSMIPAIALGAAGGVGVILGVTFVGLRASKASEAQELHDQIQSKSGTCVGGGAGPFVDDCAALASATSTGDTFGTVSLVSFIVGGAALAGMATYLLLPEERPAPAPAPVSSVRVRFSPVVGEGKGGLVVWGAF